MISFVNLTPRVSLFGEVGEGEREGRRGGRHSVCVCVCVTQRERETGEEEEEAGGKGT